MEWIDAKKQPPIVQLGASEDERTVKVVWGFYGVPHIFHGAYRLRNDGTRYWFYFHGNHMMEVAENAWEPEIYIPIGDTPSRPADHEKKAYTRQGPKEDEYTVREIEYDAPKRSPEERRANADKAYAIVAEQLTPLADRIFGEENCMPGMSHVTLMLNGNHPHHLTECEIAVWIPNDKLPQVWKGE